MKKGRKVRDMKRREKDKMMKKGRKVRDMEREKGVEEKQRGD